MTARLAALALDYTLFPAIDGRADWAQLSSLVTLPDFRQNVGREVLPGEIGCYLSHLEVWKAFLASPHDLALVLEDDVVFHDDFLAALETALRIRGAWDFLKLNKIRAKQPITQARAGQWVVNAYLGPATGSGAYLITRDLAARLLPDLLPITRPIDHELDRIHIYDFRHFGLEPFPSHVDDGNQSTITGQGFTEVRKFPWFLRLPNYALRLGRLVNKALYLLRKGRIWPKRRDL